MNYYDVTLMSAKNTTGAGTAYRMVKPGERTIQCSLEKTTVTDVTATVYFQVSNDNTNWITLATFSLNTAAMASDGFAMTAPWLYARGYVHAVSSANSAISIVMVGSNLEEHD